jgi:hypothetical protein
VTAPSQTDFLTAYTEGFAVLLANAGIGLTWHAAGEYAPTEVGIFIAAVPTSPDKLVTLTPTPMDAHPTLTDSRVDLQIRYRAGQDVRQAWAMRNATRSVLAGRFPVRLPTGVYVSSLVLSYGASLGQDDSRRWSWADNYRTRATEPRTA